MADPSSDDSKSDGKQSPSGTSTEGKQKWCSVPGCPTQGDVDKEGTCSAHGTKRKRCKIEGCPNGVVQGGVCVKHGAKRRICKFPGCQKNTKSYGLCSKHGPARKKCEVPGCSNVSVKAGKCKSHGAYATECIEMNCGKVAIQGGLCIRHYKERSAAIAAQKAFRFPQVMQATQRVQGIQAPLASLSALNPTAGMLPLQMQGVEMPLSLQLLSRQMGMPSQMCLPTQLPSIIPSQMQVGRPAYPVTASALQPGMGLQGLIDPSQSNSSYDVSLNHAHFNPGQGSNEK